MLMPEDFYIIEPKASEWVYVIQKLIRETDGIKPDDVILSLELAYPVYYLRRTKFSAERIATLVGSTPQAVSHAKVIRLEPFAESGNLPAPTVPYYGEA